MRVLVVDDNADIRMLLSQVLNVGGIEVVEADSGPAALELLRSGGELPDLVLLDIQMPFVDGWQTLTQIRADSGTAELPVVLCTVKSSPDNVARGFELGCDGYLTKPFDAGEIIAEVRAVAARSLEERRRVRGDELSKAQQSLRMIVAPRPVAA